jgi:hypothetical protein
MINKLGVSTVFLTLSVSAHANDGITTASLGERVVALGQNGTPSNGDTWDSAWAPNGDLYLQHNDGTGFDNGTYVHDRICSLQGTPELPSTLLGVNLNPGRVANSLNGWPCYSTGLYEVDGMLYHNVCYSQQIPGAFVFHHTSMMKSFDGGKTWINHLGQTNAPPPDDPNTCMFPSESWGQVNFVKYRADGAAPAVDNAQTYVYLCGTSSGFRLARIKRLDLPLLDRTRIQYYIGGDGSLDSSWSGDINGSVSLSTPSVSPTAVIYDEPLGRYVMTSFSSDSWTTPPIESTLRVVEAPHPWGPWRLILDENVNNFEGDNLTWAFIVPKFTSPDGRKLWMSVSGRAPYGLQFVPVYLSTELVQTQEAETAQTTGGVISTAVPGYSGTGYVSGLDAIGKKCEFTFIVPVAGAYILKLRYNTSAYRNLGLFVDSQQRSVLKLGKSQQVYATWTEMSTITWLDSGTNHVGLECIDNSGNVNLDKVSVGLYSTSGVAGLSSKPLSALDQSVQLDLATVPGLFYSIYWKTNLSLELPWRPFTNFLGLGRTFQFVYPASEPEGFLRVQAGP